MKGKAKLIFLVILFLGLFGWAGKSYAADHYVRQGAAGANNGSDWINAWASLPTTLTRGDTYYIADGTYPAYTFDDAVSGTQYITIKKAIQADHGTDAGWDSSYGNGVGEFARLTVSAGYLIFDGQTGGGPGSWKTGFGMKIHNDTYTSLLYMTNSPSNIQIRHVEFSFPGTEVGDTDSDDHVYGNTQVSNFTLEYSYLHDSTRTFILSRNWQNVLVQYNWFARNRSTAGSHAEGWSDNYGDYYVIRYNVWEDIEGTGVIVNLTGDDYGWEIYGNVVFWNDSTAATYTGVNNGIFTTRSAAANAYNWKIYNNSVFNHRGINASHRLYNGSNNEVKNNLWYKCENYTASGAGNYDYNTTIQCDTGTIGPNDISLPFGADPYIDSAGGDLRLSAATNSGAVISGADYGTDPAGAVRGADDIWDRGAYEYNSGAPSETTPPAAPSGLVIQ